MPYRLCFRAVHPLTMAFAFITFLLLNVPGDPSIDFHSHHELLGGGRWNNGIQLTGGSITDAGLDQISQLSRLETIDLSGSDVTDDGLEHLSNLVSLSVLNISGTKISDNGLRTIELLHRLRLLNLADTEVSDDGLAQIAELTNLWSLHMENTAISDVGLAHLTEIRGLRFLDVNGTRITAYRNSLNTRIFGALTSVTLGSRRPAQNALYEPCPNVTFAISFQCPNGIPYWTDELGDIRIPISQESLPIGLDHNLRAFLQPTSAPVSASRRLMRPAVPTVGLAKSIGKSE